MDKNIMTPVEVVVHMVVTLILVLVSVFVVGSLDQYGLVTHTFNVSPSVYFVSMVGTLVVGVFLLNYRYNRRIENRRRK